MCALMNIQRCGKVNLPVGRRGSAPRIRAKPPPNVRRFFLPLRPRDPPSHPVPSYRWARYRNEDTGMPHFLATLAQVLSPDFHCLYQ